VTGGVNWLSTVISIPPLFGLKDPVVEEDRVYNLSGRPEALLNTVGAASIYPLVLENTGTDRDSWKDQSDSTMASISSEWVNETVTLDAKLPPVPRLYRNSIG